MKTESKITKYSRQIMGEIGNDCPGCLQAWVRDLTLREATLGFSILAWQYNSEANVVNIFYGNLRTGEVMHHDELHDPEDIEC
jgi:hypothetical protein